jgi:hypothetical protein
LVGYGRVGLQARRRSTTGFDLEELAGVADDDLRSAWWTGARSAEHSADHGGLVDHEDVVRSEARFVGPVEGFAEPGDGHRRDSRSGLELAGGLGGQGGPDQGAAGGSPGVVGRREGVGLARPGDAGHHLDAVARSADPPDHRLLLVAERRTGSDGRLDVVGSGEAGAGVAAVGGHADEVLLDRQQVGRGPAAGVDRDGSPSTVASADALGAGLCEGHDMMGVEVVVGQAETSVVAAPAGSSSQTGGSLRRSKVERCR